MSRSRLVARPAVDCGFTVGEPLTGELLFESVVSVYKRVAYGMILRTRETIDRHSLGANSVARCSIQKKGALGLLPTSGLCQLWSYRW